MVYLSDGRLSLVKFGSLLYIEVRGGLRGTGMADELDTKKEGDFVAKYKPIINSILMEFPYLKPSPNLHWHLSPEKYRR